jgi:iron(II)-dependent oxidoreductase
VLAGLLAASLAGLAFSPDARSRGPDGADMVMIPAGEFWMGRSHHWLLDELGMHLRPRLDDQPVHQVYLDSYWIDRHEVTNQQYARFAETTGRRTPFHWIGGQILSGKDDHPVYNVTWEDAAAYCQFVGKRLPTEAEWERAARGGLERALYPWGDKLIPAEESREGASEPAAPRRRAHYGLPDGATRVGSYPPNGFGLYDLTGNVWEWVQDWYERGYYSVSPERNPQGPETGLYRVIRGGGWSDSDERILAVHYRNFTNPTLPSNTVGFRCARSAR